MKSGGPLRRTPLNRAKKRINPRSDKKVAYRASSDGQRDLAYMGAVRDMPCIICRLHEEPQQSPTQFHHTIHGRFGTRRTPDRDGIGLCEGHHLGMIDTSKIAVHAEPERWKELYGQDTDYIEKTRKLVGETT